MTNRRTPAKRPTQSHTTGSWKPTIPRAELLKAIGAGAGVVVVTVLLIFVMKPADTSSAPDTSVPAVTTPTQPAGSTTLPTQPAGSTTTPSQP